LPQPTFFSIFRIEPGKEKKEEGEGKKREEETKWLPAARGCCREAPSPPHAQGLSTTRVPTVVACCPRIACCPPSVVVFGAFHPRHTTETTAYTCPRMWSGISAASARRTMRFSHTCGSGVKKVSIPCHVTQPGREEGAEIKSILRFLMGSGLGGGGWRSACRSASSLC